MAIIHLPRNPERQLLNQQYWNALALRAIRIIRSRTRKGKDVEGRAFRQYNKQYLKKRQADGILNASLVNLEYSRVAGMLKSIDHMVSNDLTSVRIFFNNERAQTLARYHHEMGAGKSRVIRRFFDLSPAEAKEIGGTGTTNSKFMDIKFD